MEQNMIMLFLPFRSEWFVFWSGRKEIELSTHAPEACVIPVHYAP